MSRTIFISKALAMTEVADVREKFEELDLGVIATIDMKEYTRDGADFRKFWIGSICIECRCRPFGDLRRRFQFGGGEDAAVKPRRRSMHHAPLLVPSQSVFSDTIVDNVVFPGP